MIEDWAFAVLVVGSITWGVLSMARRIHAHDAREARRRNPRP